MTSHSVFLTFGKYKNKSVAEVLQENPTYFQWMLEQPVLPHPWKDIANAVVHGLPLDQYRNELPPPDPGIASDGGRTVTLTLAENGRVIVKFAYNKSNPADVQFKDELKQAVEGLTWEGSPRFRWTVGASSLPKLITAFGGKKYVYASDDVKQLYAQEMVRRSTLDTIRAQEDSDIEIPNILLPLRNYQRVAVSFATEAGGRALIADSPGLGKTATAIGYAMYHGLRTLVVCPKSVIITWEREITRFTGHASCIWTGNTRLGELDAPFHIINYDIVERHAQALIDLKFDLLVCDEATYIKSHKAKRTKAIMGVWKERDTYPGIHTPHVLLLTGTPVLNKPLEAFQLLRFLSKDRFKNVLKFMEDYGRQGEKPRNLDDLHARTKDLMIRRRKQDVLKEMPSKQRDDLVVELPPAAMKEYNKILDSIFRQWNVLGSPSAAQMPAIQKFLLPYKLERAYEFIDEMIGNDESVLVFSQYRQPILDIQARYGSLCGVIMGGMDTTQRQRTVDGLRDRRLKVGAMTITAAGMGIDGIQHGVSTVIFLDRYWQPSVHEQAEDRVHRSGQTESVQVYYLTCKDTIDEDMAMVLTEKQEMIDKIVDGQVLETSRNKSIFKDFIARVRMRRSKELAQLADPDDNEEFVFDE